VQLLHQLQPLTQVSLARLQSCQCLCLLLLVGGEGLGQLLQPHGNMLLVTNLHSDAKVYRVYGS
jgi:hypothetical protein